MQVFTKWDGIEHKGASVAIGNFDGVHLGHQSVLNIARGHGPLGVITFEPHPREVFAPNGPPFRLMNAEAKRNRLAKLGVEYLYELPFGPALSDLSPQTFGREVLVDGIGASHVTVGADFHFGKARAGTPDTLRDLGAQMGFGVSVADLLHDDSVEISSTNIRKALADGRPRDAAAMLGHWHRIEGAVLHGDARGRDMGYPTANMSITGLHPPKFGIYAVLIDVLSGPHAGNYRGAASCGVRPMFGDTVPNLETHIFDFSGDLYDDHVSVALVEYLRGEEKFDNVDALVAQMDADCARARTILADV
ncbi:bifunctional riboflavin kinase/FAD synthetase [Aliiroseovarius sp. PTFE2010]|uniref:bifunctional riboflavin kinase/FAD synthetase n=1 Tax=Aliiroseovarius sp. PTFE2010 TaxID=3417190 RepID=UPI003CF10715